MLEPRAYVPNPSLPFAWLSINGTSVTIDDASGKPRHLVSFSCDFSIETLGTFEFVLFDPEYDFVESLIAQSKGACEFWFGYTDGRQSPKYEGVITEYVPEFLFDGIRIHLRGFTAAHSLTQKVHHRSWSGFLISEIVTKIAEANDPKLSAHVEETKRVPAREGLEGTNFEHKTFVQNSSDWKFITEVLMPAAISAKGDVGGYRLHFEPDKKKLHFHTAEFKEEDTESDSGESIKQYVWRDKKTEVLRFAPVFSGGMLASGLWNATAVMGMSQENSNQFRLLQTPNNEQKVSPDGSTDSSKTKTTTPTANTPEECGAQIVQAHLDETLARNEALFWYYRNAYQASYNADSTLEIVGDPLAKPWGKIDIVVQTKYGSRHYCDGIFMKWGAVHNITESGNYTTTFKLMKSDRKDGDQVNKSTAGG